MEPTPQQQAEAVRRLVVDGVADAQTAFDHVTAEQRGRQLAARLNAERGQIQPPKTNEAPKKP